jgi:hypothetical protein
MFYWPTEQKRVLCTLPVSPEVCQLSSQVADVLLVKLQHTRSSCEMHQISKTSANVARHDRSELTVGATIARNVLCGGNSNSR